ncbi:hypothetical protein MC885_019760 [Smutsia gigantea]|nr:hypothetical protein MC885_019760 [Smutsia gigantea]
MALCLAPALLLLLGSPSSAGPNRCVDAAEACTADARCQQLRSQYVAQCLGRAALGGCPRARCHRALRRFFARGPPALTHALLFCPCANPACAERRRQTFVPACAFAGPGGEPPSCLEPLDVCEHSRICRPPARQPRAPLTAACATRPPTACAPTRASWVRTAGNRARAGLSRGCLRLRGPTTPPSVLAGTALTPNYVDNASALVAPWCGCGASGNRREECEAFRGLFTRNACLDGAIQAFESSWPPILQDQLDIHRDPENGLLQPSVPPCHGYRATSVAFCFTERGLAYLPSWPSALAGCPLQVWTPPVTAPGARDVG